MPDFTRITKRFNRGNASLEDVVRVYQAVSKVRLLDAERDLGHRRAYIPVSPQLPQMISLLQEVQPIHTQHIDLIERLYIQPLKVGRYILRKPFQAGSP